MRITVIFPVIPMRLINVMISTGVENHFYSIAAFKIIAEFKIFATYKNNSSNAVDMDFKVEDHFQQFIDYIQTKIEPSDILSEEISLLGSN